jgi:hypothetical protein
MNPDIDPNQIEYIDFNESLRKYSKILKGEHNCDLVVAINHMRVPNDKLMAKENNSDVVDLIFGGHDHTYFVEFNPDTDVHVTKSACDFECFTNLTVYFGVEKEDFQEFKNNFEGVLKGGNLSYFQKNFPVKVDYSEKLKRVYIAERVFVSDIFERDPEG